jgi:hypothetical protein
MVEIPSGWGTLAIKSSSSGNGAIEPEPPEGSAMNNLIYIVGLVVIVIFVLGFFGLR